MKGVPHYSKDGKEHKGGTHKIPDGSLHSGKTIVPNGDFILKICLKVYKEELLCSKRKKIMATPQDRRKELRRNPTNYLARANMGKYRAYLRERLAKKEKRQNRY